jgi:hypothetical protein
MEQQRNYWEEMISRIDSLTGTEQLLARKLCETYNVAHRIKRYERRLIKEGFTRYQGKDMELEEVKPGAVDADPLIELARQTLPTLHRKYYADSSRYFKNLREIDALVSELERSGLFKA